MLRHCAVPIQIFETLFAYYYHLYNLKNVKNRHWGVFFSKVADFSLKLSLGCFSRFLNCTNDTKSRNGAHIVEFQTDIQSDILSSNAHEFLFYTSWKPQKTGKLFAVSILWYLHQFVFLRIPNCLLSHNKDVFGALSNTYGRILMSLLNRFRFLYLNLLFLDIFQCKFLLLMNNELLLFSYFGCSILSF